MQDDADWDRFMATLRSPLPACFRVNPNNPFAAKLKSELAQFTGSALQGSEVQGEEQKKPSLEQIPWFPNGMAFKLGTDRRSIRRTEGLESLHRWMIQHTDNGNITRQEAVSMVPPLALDVRPSHRCLDMCAAPGSKTTQLLEVVGGSWRADGSEEATGESRTQGIVVANDADTDRCASQQSPLP
jgi:16S rRNA C967 or C1407 C5-methylase (RsmB/RsmF family)